MNANKAYFERRGDMVYVEGARTVFVCRCVNSLHAQVAVNMLNHLGELARKANKTPKKKIKNTP